MEEKLKCLLTLNFTLAPLQMALGTKVCDVIEIAAQRGNCTCSHAPLASGRLLLPAYLYEQSSLLAQVTAE